MSADIKALVEQFAHNTAWRLCNDTDLRWLAAFKRILTEDMLRFYAEVVGGGPSKRIADLEAFQTAVTVAIGAGHGGAAYADVPKMIRALYAERDELTGLLEERRLQIQAHRFAEDRLQAQVETLTTEHAELKEAYDAVKADFWATLKQKEAQLTTLRTALRDLCDAIPAETLAADPPLEAWHAQAEAALARSGASPSTTTSGHPSRTGNLGTINRMGALE